MYPRAELVGLANRKESLQRRLAERRGEWADAAERAMRPLVVVDNLMERWRQLAPLIKLATVPLGLLLGRKVLRRARLVYGLTQWAPMVVAMIRAWRGAKARS